MSFGDPERIQSLTNAHKLATALSEASGQLVLIAGLAAAGAKPTLLLVHLQAAILRLGQLRDDAVRLRDYVKKAAE